MSKSKSRAKAVHQPIPETRAMDIPFDQLQLSEKNVRTIYSKETVAELAESIASNGLIQSLSVRPLKDEDGNDTGRYEVQAGGRRFRALEQLVKQKRRPADQLTPCVVKTEGFAEDDSYVENVQREALHPIDEFKAFKAMLDAGKSETDIASTHRVSVAFVRQRLRLAAASPVILEAFRNEEMELDQLMAFCVVDDHARQESVWGRIQESYNDSARAIRDMLTEDSISTCNPRVRFIGLDAYEKAGGHVERDLFSQTDEGYLTDAELVNQLVAKKLEAECKKLLKQGWKWVEADVSFPYGMKWNMDRLIGEDQEMNAKEQQQHAKLTAELETLDALDELTEEQDARRDELQDQIEALEERPTVYAADDMTRAGVFISLNNDGSLNIDTGFIKDDEPASEDANGADTEGGEAESKAEPSGDETAVKPLSAALVQDLTSFRTVALRNALGQDFKVAFIAVVHALALSRFYLSSFGKSCLQVKMDTSFPAKAPGLDTWTTTKQLTDRDLAWKKLLPKEPGALWETLFQMDQSSLQSLFAHLASLSVNTVVLGHYHNTGALNHADKLAAALDTDMVKAGWVPTAENYLGRVSKAHILEAVSEARDDNTAMLISHMKKEGMVKEAERLLEGKGWLPVPLRNGDPSLAADDDADIGLADEEAEDEVLPEFLSGDADAGEANAAIN